MKLNTVIFLIFCMTFTCCAQSQNSRNLLKNLLNSRPDLFKKISSDSKYEIQIIYTQINRNEKNIPSFESFYYGVDAKKYFYPASVVKFPTAMLALEKLKKLKLPRATPLRIEAAREPQKEVLSDSSSANYQASIAHYIKKIFLVSDNDAFNRLYEFLGQAQINESLHQKGYEDVQIIHRLASSKFGPEENRYTNPIEFYQGDNILYRQEEVFNPTTYPPKVHEYYKGKAHINNRGRLIRKPFDFRQKNYLSLETMHRMLKAVIFPEAVPEKNRFDIYPEDYDFVYRYMSMFPRESQSPRYQEDYHHDAFVKYIQFGGSEEPIPGNIRIFNKVGLAYGYMIENAYVVDFEAKTEYLVSAVIYVNKNQILNDGRYEYKDIGFPFLANLGKVISWHEKHRHREYLPDLNRFMFNYKKPE